MISEASINTSEIMGSQSALSKYSAGKVESVSFSRNTKPWSSCIQRRTPLSSVPGFILNSLSGVSFFPIEAGVAPELGILSYH